ncbi:MAG: ribosome small subunit-dependent GTPase A [Gemmatimonadales bacterium]|nr:ribosome small subunit-dependent GTPase A [Gemmatimonadales bacterium]
MNTNLTGTVLERDGSVYQIATPEGTVRAVLRGKAKDEGPKVVVGDIVSLEIGEAGGLFGITAVEPRRSVLARRVPEGRGLRPVVANVDQVVVVTAAVDPAPVPQLLDRLLAIAEVNHLTAAIAINKIDLAPGDALAERFHSTGYPVYLTSAKTGEGIPELRKGLRGRASVVTGPSGAGKSSLLNAIESGLKLRVREISAKIRRGRQTTVSAIMIPLTEGGYVIDTPGFSEVGLWGVEPAELAECFPEFRPLIASCRFADCRHKQEPDCAVQQAVVTGSVRDDRYASYLALLSELESAPKPWE